MASQHHRSHSHHTKKASAHGRPARPAPLAKRASHHGSSSKAALKAERHREEDDDLMAVSFLQYCATCEKQIIVPSNSILYCSESCKRKDNNKTLSFYSFDASPPQTPFGAHSFEDMPIPEIVVPRSPTTLPSHRYSYGYQSETSEDENASEKGSRHQPSEAARYLRQFQFQSPKCAHPYADTARSRPPSRPRYNRASGSVTSLNTAPSLSQTPASSASIPMPYTPSTRPLPPRTNPHSSSYGAKSIDLVVPLTPTAPTGASSYGYSMKSAPTASTSVGVAEGEVRYEKRTSLPGASSGKGSLGQLFAYDSAGRRKPWG